MPDAVCLIEAETGVSVSYADLYSDSLRTAAWLASLGVTGRTLVNDSGQPSGVGVVAVTPNGPAADAGIAAGDVITSLNNTTITSLAQMQAELATLQPGNKVPVGLVKANGTKATAQVTLGTLQVS